MGSVYEEITRLEAAKADIETAIEGCGVNVPDTELISGYASYIRQIPSAVLSNLNVEESGGTDQYIKSIKQENGLIATTIGGIVSSTSSGLVPKITIANDSIINSQNLEWVLTTDGSNIPIWKKLPPSAFEKIVSFNPTSISLTTDWSASGFILDNIKFTSGTYAIKITYSNLIFSGTVSVFVGKITVEDEVVLHMSGIPKTYADGTQGRIYAKIAPSNTHDYGEIYLSTNVPESNITNLSITMKKLI